MAKRRVRRIPVKADRRTKEGLKNIEAFNAMTERAVQADLHSGLTKFRGDVEKAQLDAAFNARNYKGLIEKIPWSKLDAHLAPAAQKLGGIIPQTHAQVRRGIVGGVTGNAADDPTFYKPIDFSGGRHKDGATAKPKRLSAIERRTDLTNPRTAEARAGRVNDYLKGKFGLTVEGRKRIQSIVADNALSGRGPGAAVDRISDALRQTAVSREVRNQIGLNRQQVVALHNYEDDLKANSGHSAEKIDALVDKRSDALLADRAQLIAVTETRVAQGNAQVQAWLAMQEQGLIGPNSRKIWTLGWEHPCPDICEPADGVSVLLDEMFTLGKGVQAFAGGGGHPRCKCLMLLWDPDVDEETPERNKDAFTAEDID